MESLYDELEGVNAFDDKERRLPTRTQASVPKVGSQTTRRKGFACEDLGSGFIGGPNGKGKPKVKGSRPHIRISRQHNDASLDSDDEMDCLSSSQPDSASDTGAPVRKRSKETGKEMDQDLVFVDKDGNKHGYDPRFPPTKAENLKNLKFKKNKSAIDGPPTTMSSSVAPLTSLVLKEQGTNRELLGASFGISTPQKMASRTSIGRARSPAPAVSQNRTTILSQRIPSAGSSKPTEDRKRSENTRPKPRPLGRAVSTQQKPHPLPDIFPSDTVTPCPPARRSTVTEPRTFPLSLSDSEPVDSCRSRHEEKLAPAAFPQLSPVTSPARPAEFPSLTPLVSQGKRGTVEKPYPKKGTRTQASPTTPKSAIAKKVKDVSAFPALSPLSLAMGRNGEMTAKSKLKQKGRSGYKNESKDDNSDIEGLESSSGQPRAKPFPMSTQVLNGIGSPDTTPRAGPSRPGKRSSSDGSDAEERRKRIRKDREDGITQSIPLDDYAYDEDDDTLMISPSTDPRTLCPYCDSPLPASPTSVLTCLLTATAKKSSRDPRPTNPLGRKAPFAVFIAVCQRHRFENEILPEAEQKGWPKEIEWTELGKRVGRMKKRLKALIDDVREELLDDDDKGEGEDVDGLFTDEDDRKGEKVKRGPRSNCVFWKEVMAEVKKKGSRAVAGVRGQFANFEKTQPGYYGELGSVIIHQTLYDLFPPASIDPNLISPLTVNEFIQRILVPEVGVRLIMEDQELQGNEGIEAAVCILRESASYGVAMFPEDGGEWGVGGRGSGNGRRRRGGDVEELGVADRIVMERARKRRKELEKEEAEEEEETEMEMGMGKSPVTSDIEIEDGKPVKPVPRSRKQPEPSKKAKAKAKGKAKEIDPPLVIAPRPKPRPLGKNSSSASVLTSGNDFGTASRGSQGTGEEDVGLDLVGTTAPPKPRPKRKLSSYSPTPSDLEKTDTESDAGKISRPSTAIPGDDTILDLCSGTDDDSQSRDSKTVAREAKTRRKRKHEILSAERPASEPFPEVDDTEDDLPEVILPLGTPIAQRTRQAPVEDTEGLDETPRPVRSYVSRTASATDSSFLPLMAARERRGKRSESDAGASATGPARRGASFSWLLSDSSQSFEG